MFDEFVDAVVAAELFRSLDNVENFGDTGMVSGFDDGLVSTGL